MMRLTVQVKYIVYDIVFIPLLILSKIRTDPVIDLGFEVGVKLYWLIDDG